MAWHEAMVKFGHKVSFEQARSQIGKGGDKLIPFFLSPEEQKDHGRELEEWRSRRFKSRYLSLVRPFSAVPDLLQRVREAGLRVAVASSAKRDELEQFLEIAGVTRLVDEASSSEDVEESKPAPTRRRPARRTSPPSVSSAAGSTRARFGKLDSTGVSWTGYPLLLSRQVLTRQLALNSEKREPVFRKNITSNMRESQV